MTPGEWWALYDLREREGRGARATAPTSEELEELERMAEKNQRRTDG